jgi:Flp pilus assembly CpaE family ATPase
VLLVANRANAGNDITTEVIEQYLGIPVGAALPSDGRALIECVNLGQLVVTAHPELPVAKEITGLARTVASNFGWEPSPELEAAPEPSKAKAPRFRLPKFNFSFGSKAVSAGAAA